MQPEPIKPEARRADIGLSPPESGSLSAELPTKLPGHSSKTVHRCYTHDELEALKNAASKLPF
jgi:hypothetical protein